jgi:hypothetical protein
MAQRARRPTPATKPSTRNTRQTRVQIRENNSSVTSPVCGRDPGPARLQPIRSCDAPGPVSAWLFVSIAPWRERLSRMASISNPVWLDVSRPMQVGCRPLLRYRVPSRYDFALTLPRLFFGGCVCVNFPTRGYAFCYGTCYFCTFVVFVLVSCLRSCLSAKTGCQQC